MVQELIQQARILVVDDQEPNVRLLERILQHNGATQITGTTDPRHVATLYTTLQPDLIILDLMMPDLDGFAVMEQLAPLIPAETYLPILVITADVTSETRRRALAGGAKDFLTKPIDPVEVILRIKNLLEIRLLHQQLQQRIARDIHDGPLQDLGALLMTVELCTAQLEAGAVVPALAGLQYLRAALSDTVHELRGVVKNLRPLSLDNYGLAYALTMLSQRMRRTNDPLVILENDLRRPLPPHLEVTLFYLVQEGLTNICKHAAAQRAVVQLTESANAVHLVVRDDGRGFAVTERLHQALATGHIGLAGMYERVKLAGGQLTIESSPTGGTTVHCVLPFVIGDSPDA